MKKIKCPSKLWRSWILLSALCVTCPEVYSQWSLTGNAGTNSSTNFIGTTDNVALKIRTKNSVRMTISSGGKVGIGTGSPAFRLDVKGGSINTDSVYRIGGITVLSIKGTENTFIGAGSGLSHTSGNNNTASGNGALYSNTTGSFNTANGNGALYSNTIGFYNTAGGRNALYFNTTGYGNIAIGSTALYANTTGSNNTAIGGGALYSNVTGSLSVAIGMNAMAYANNTSSPFTNSNVAIGYEALRGSLIAANNTGNNNTAIGHQTMVNNTTGENNTAIGFQALNSNITGNSNTANGYQALKSNTTGYSNTAHGWGTLYANTTGFANTSSGLNALYSNTTGFFNTATGAYALHSNVAGSYATAIGEGAMFYANSTAIPFTNYNVAVGYQALRGSVTAANNTGNYNTAVGYQPLWSITTGIWNTANGYSALYSNTTGGSNTASGYLALYSNITGSQNTASGTYSLNSNTGSFNTAFGAGAFQFNTTGTYNTGTGYYSGPSVGTLNYATAIGASTAVNAGNKVRIGDAGITVIEGQVVYSWPSDGRFKEDIKDDVKGLDFILKLQPVSYNFNRLRFAQHVRQHLTPDREKTLIEQSQNRSVGFIAQDVEKIIQQTGFSSFDAVHAPAYETDNYSMGYAEFVVPLVKAVQELNEESLRSKIQSSKLEEDNALLKIENKELASEIEMIKSVLSEDQQQKLKDLRVNKSSPASASEMFLEQNQPNPFHEKTVIRYSVPKPFSSAVIQLSDNSSRILKTVVIQQSGNGELIINANEFAAGVYQYTLIVDGKATESKQMVLTK